MTPAPRSHPNLDPLIVSVPRALMFAAWVGSVVTMVELSVAVFATVRYVCGAVSS